MIKKLRKIGNSYGVLIDKAILDLHHFEANGSIEMVATAEGLLLKPLSTKEAYNIMSKKHKKSLEKLSK